MTPEVRARQDIDRLLHESGWGVLNRSEMNIFDAQEFCQRHGRVSRLPTEAE